MSELIAVGRIGKARGIKGHAFVQPWTDDPESRFAVGSVLETEPTTAGPLTVVEMSQASGKLVVLFDGVCDRSAIEALRGVQLVVPKSARPVLDDPDDFYASDLVGLEVRTVSGEVVGPIDDVIEIAGADYLAVQLDGVERLIPFVREIVPTVDIAGRFIVIDPPEGLFEL